MGSTVLISVNSTKRPILPLFNMNLPSCKLLAISLRMVSRRLPPVSILPFHSAPPTARSLLSSVTTRKSSSRASSDPSFLRWRAVQDAAFEDPDDGLMKCWSESHVSEDFDQALRLQLKGWSLRWASYSNGGFQEGVSLTADDEVGKVLDCG